MYDLVQTRVVKWLGCVALVFGASSCMLESEEAALVEEPVGSVSLASLADTCPNDPSKRCLRCYEAAICDTDGDTFARHDCTSTKEWVYPASGGTKACPSGWLQFTEPRGCDLFTPETFNYSRPESLVHVVLSSFDDRYPHRGEVSNGLDDDCDGRIDEGENDYNVNRNGATLGEGKVDFRLYVFDSRVRAKANRLRVTAWRLEDLEPGDLDSLGHSNEAGVNASYCSRKTLTYSGESVFEGEANPCSGEGVFVLSFQFLYAFTLAGVTRSTEVRCFDADGTLGNWDTCPWNTVVYNDPVFSAEYSSGAPSISRTRALVVNAALYQWFLSNILGMIGGQQGGPSAYPGGTAYGADYGELWCSEFSSKMFNRGTSAVSGSITTVEGFIDFWSGISSWKSDGPAYLASGAKFGDYLAMNTIGEAGKKSHSGIFMALSKRDDNVWRVAGNEDNYVGIKGVARTHESDSGNRYHIGVGRLSNQAPRY